MEATPQQNAEGLAIVRVLAAVLDRLVSTNNRIARSGDPGQVTKFHAMKAPGIDILQYLERIHKYASCSNECYILALIYIDRLIQRNNFLLTDLNVHRVAITAVLLAAKFFDDAYYNNAYYAKIGGVLVSEMNGLEVDFLFRVNFSLHATPEVFHQYRTELLSHFEATNTTPEPQYYSMTPPMQSVEPPLSVCTPSPNQIHPAPMPVAPQLGHGLRMISEITPSPPIEASRGMEYHHNPLIQPQFPNDFLQDFLAMQRANSMPIHIPQPAASWQSTGMHQRYASDSAYMTAVADPFQIVAPDSAYTQHFEPRLAGMSGAGL